MKKTARTHVTDHAIIRYLERQWGVDIAGLKYRIGRRADLALDTGATAVNVDGLHYVIQDGCVVSVTKVKRRKGKRRAKGA